MIDTASVRLYGAAEVKVAEVFVRLLSGLLLVADLDGMFTVYIPSA
jgi:hypothetical protein